jgi:hypothetical protein
VLPLFAAPDARSSHRDTISHLVLSHDLELPSLYAVRASNDSAHSVAALAFRTCSLHSKK